MSSLHYQQQDLDMIKDDLDALKFGYALLQHSSDKQLYKLKDIIDSKHPCGGKDWVKVVDIDMGRPSQQCPPGWQETGYDRRTCGRVNPAPGTCNVATFPVSDYLPSYSQVCGRIVAYQFGSTKAFSAFENDNLLALTDSYVDGVVLYHGTSEPQHIWTFAVGITEIRLSPQPRASYCPCDRDTTDNIQIPSFVESHYFCESQNLPFIGVPLNFMLYGHDFLWDGEFCLPNSNCCEFNRPPYFIKTLPEPTCEDIVASICLDDPSPQADVGVQVVEIYVHK